MLREPTANVRHTGPDVKESGRLAARCGSPLEDVSDLRVRRHQTPLNALNPPSTGMIAPETKAAASLTSHKSVPSRSSGVPYRLAGVCVRIV